MVAQAQMEKIAAKKRSVPVLKFRDLPRSGDPVTLGPNATLSMKSYTDTAGVRGDTVAEAVFTVGLNNWIAARNLLIGAASDMDPYVACAKVQMRYVGNDAFSGMAQLTCSFVPIFSVEAWTVDLPFKVRYEDCGTERIPLRGQALTWADNSPIVNRMVYPDYAYPVQKLVLFGSRSTFDAGTYASLETSGEAGQLTVNSGSFLGGGDECVRLLTAKGTPKQLYDGSIIYQVEIPLVRRPFSWNWFWNETKLQWDSLSWPPYTAVDYSSLLD